MNKRGSVIFISFMLGIVCFFLGMALAPALKDVIAEQTNTDVLNCTDTTVLTQLQHATCTSIDMFNPLLIGILFGLGGMLISIIAIN